ncbi:MAG: tetratricopeptide repeat protein [Burkholderiales bacterium]|nr:tetratricopeptide repeat protein [Burkholderiales bacterium]
MSALASELPALAGQHHWSQGVALADAERWGDAARAFARATRVAPNDAVYWLNLANALRRSGRLTRAVAMARRCLRVNPGDAIALRVAGECLLGMHRHAEAAEVYAELERNGDSDARTMVQQASALLGLQQPGEAAQVLLRALVLEPALVDAHLLLADACREQGLRRESVECIKTALALDPGNVQAVASLSYEKRHVCDWSDFEADLARLRDELECTPDGLARVLSVFALLSLPLAPELQLVAARGEALAMSMGVRPLPAAPAAASGARIRVGWLSYDYREHPVAHLMHDVLATIDRERFEVVLYSLGPDDGSTNRRRMETVGDRFVDLRGMTDRRAAEKIRADGIEILVDLMGHTRGRRMTILAFKPAPIQVGFLGYPGSSGADFIDYLIGDPLVTPLAAAAHYSEKLALMPLTFQPNGRDRPLPQTMTRAEAGLPEDAFVLCTFNNPYKILPEVFDAWCAVLRELPQAVLWMRETNGQMHENVAREARARGVDPARIVYARPVPQQQHYSRLALADLFVDSWPYNAHTTAADALWAGVPVVTHYGASYASRVAASALNACGIADLAFASVEEYRLAILALALEPGLLATYRRHLETQRLALPLFDTARYTGELQSLLQRMVERRRAGLAPAHLPPAA